LAPVPALAGNTVHLYGPQAASSSHWDIYNIAGERVAGVDADAFGGWDPSKVSSGIYIARVKVQCTDGSQPVVMQKLAVIH
jgi:hypothetical protein